MCEWIIPDEFLDSETKASADGQGYLKELVRCKDCKHLFDGEHNLNCCAVLMEKAKWVQEIIVDDDWFCADGERKSE